MPEHTPAATGSSLSPAPRVRPSLATLFRVSLGLGAVGFGGGISVLAAIHGVTVDKRRWLTEKEFTNTATVAQMLPGGAAANTLAYLGLRFHGIPGAAVGYIGFVLPGALSILALAWAYVRFGTLLHVETLLAGFNAAVVGIIASITLRMVRTSIARLWQMFVAGAALLLSLAGDAPPGEIALLGIGAGLILDLGFERARLLRFYRRKKRKPPPPVALPEEGQPLPRAVTSVEPTGTTAKTMMLIVPAALGFHVTGLDTELLRLAILFFRTGLGAYGGGFAIITSLHADLRLHGWMTEQQFADAIAVGKLTPGPVLLMATFIGYIRAGIGGALVATVAILLAPFGLVVVLGTWLDRVRSRRLVRAGLRGLTPAVVGLMASAGLTLGTSLHSLGLAIATAVGLTLVRFEINPVGMLVAAGLTRIALRLVAGL